EDCSVSTFRPRARPLFQYRHYSEQQPLKLNPTEVGEVISAVCSETSMPNANLMTITTGLSSHRTKPSIDVAVSVLIKLVIDMYLLDPDSAAPLTLSMLEDMVCSPRLSPKTRAFDLILNLAVHAHLLEPVMADDVSTIEEDYPQESSLESEAQVGIQQKRKDTHKNIGNSSAIDNFESWILNILCETLLLLVQIEEKQEYVWASALSCLLYFVCDGGRIRRSRLKGLDVRILEKVMTEFDSIVSSFTHLQKEFSDMRQHTRSCKFLKGIDDGVMGRTVSNKAKLSWATLHSLLHSERITCRQNGYIWLGDLLRAEISEERGGDLFSNISSLRKQIALVDLKDPSARPDIPLSISLMCGLLKSKDSTVRAGFLSVLEVLLMRCKFLLDENGREESAAVVEIPMRNAVLRRQIQCVTFFSPSSVLKSLQHLQMQAPLEEALIPLI
ncbi:Vacuolar protein sorting-associated protein 13b, partial [Bienertia sinuspersici]